MASSIKEIGANLRSWNDAWEHEHFAQVYESDGVLVDAVSNYVRQALADHGAAIVIATQPHLADLRTAWAAMGIDFAAASQRGQLVVLDASATLASLMGPLGLPQRELFYQIIEPVVAAAVASHTSVVAFGEMVSLLWEEGNLEGAVLLEDFWNELRQAYAFTLFCAYRLRHADAHAQPLDAICQKHSRVIPAERNMRMYTNDPLRVIARMKQELDVRQELEEGLAHLAAIVASSDDAIVSKTLNGIIKSWNAGAERMFGYSAEEAIGQPITLIIPATLRDEERSILQKICAGDRLEHFETTRVRKDGSLLPISLTISPIRDHQGRIIGASKIARDISARRRAEKAVAEAQAQLISEAEALETLNTLSARLWHAHGLQEGLEQMVDAAMQLLNADKADVQLLSGSVLHARAQSGFDADFREKCAGIRGEDTTACGRALRTRQRVVVEDVAIDPEFEPYRALAQAAGFRSVVSIPLLSAEQTMFGVLSVHFGQPHCPSQQQLRRLDLYARQAGDFIQRCHAEDALREKAEQLRFADQRKDEFLATLAHELRNPLAPISNVIQLLRLDGNSLPKNMIEILERQVIHIVRLVDDLFEVSRITRGKLDLKLESIDLQSVIRTSVETSRPSIDRNRHNLKLELPDEPVLVRGDPIRLSQVFANLLNNAAKYTNAGGEISVQVHTVSDSAVVEVRDTGIGIAPDQIARLFEMFSQVDQNATRSSGGLGIGLWLVKQLVELHKGSVLVMSDGLGHGSCVQVKLPLLTVRG
jgi:PAS domain S-box-containing protein